MDVFINERLAKEILDSASFCYGKGQGGDLSLLLRGIRIAYPELWDRYSYLKVLLEA